MVLFDFSGNGRRVEIVARERTSCVEEATIGAAAAAIATVATSPIAAVVHHERVAAVQGWRPQWRAWSTAAAAAADGIKPGGWKDLAAPTWRRVRGRVPRVALTFGARSLCHSTLLDPADCASPVARAALNTAYGAGGALFALYSVQSLLYNALGTQKEVLFWVDNSDAFHVTLPQYAARMYRGYGLRAPVVAARFGALFGTYDTLRPSLPVDTFVAHAALGWVASLAGIVAGHAAAYAVVPKPMRVQIRVVARNPCSMGLRAVTGAVLFAALEQLRPAAVGWRQYGVEVG